MSATDTLDAPGAGGPRPPTAGTLKRLFSGQSDIAFIPRSALWLKIGIAAILLSIAALALRGINFGIDFTGGTAFLVSGATGDFESADLRSAVGELVDGDVTAQVVTDEIGRGALVTTPPLEGVAGPQQAQILDRLAEVTGADRATIDVTAVGPRWGAQISRQALQGLIVFLVLVVIYITLRFELKMALAALVTLVHDVVLTIGIYALVGFEVTPASVIALLTILGYSLYDTVVVFDRVTEDTVTLNTTSTRTYGEVANAALNQVLVRSLSTSITSLLPVGSLLFIGGNLLGADTLTDLALALFVGMAVGTYSSIFVATPMLVFLKEREPKFADLKQKLEARRGAAVPAPAKTTRAAKPGAKPGQRPGQRPGQKPGQKPDQKPGRSGKPRS
jgi:preprotein translocase subunit SecF